MHTIYNSVLKVLLVFITFQALCSPYSFRNPSKSKNLFKNFLSFKEDTNQTYDGGRLGNRNNSSENNKGDKSGNNSGSSKNNSDKFGNNSGSSKNNSDKFENNFERIGNSKNNGERFRSNADNNFRKSKNNGDRFGNSVVENNYGKSKSNGDRFGNNVDWVGNNVGNIGESYKNSTELLRYNGDDGVEVILRKNLQIPVQNATKYYYLFDKEGLGGIHRSISQLFPSKLNHIQMSDRCKLKRPNIPDNYPKYCEKMEESETELNAGSEPSVQINIVSPVILVNVNESKAINFSDMTKKKPDDDKWKGCKTFPKYVYA